MGASASSSPSHQVATGSFAVGEKVEAIYDGTWYNATIKQVFTGPDHTDHCSSPACEAKNAKRKKGKKPTCSLCGSKWVGKHPNSWYLYWTKDKQSGWTAQEVRRVKNKITGLSGSTCFRPVDAWLGSEDGKALKVEFRKWFSQKLACEPPPHQYILDTLPTSTSPCLVSDRHG